MKMTRKSSASRLLGALMGSRNKDAETDSNSRPSVEKGGAGRRKSSLDIMRERVERARGSKGLRRIHSREKNELSADDGGSVTAHLSPIPETVMNDEMNRARLLAAKYSSENIVESLGGYLNKAPEGRRMSLITANPYSRWFRLVYHKRVCEWHLRWYTDEWQEDLVNECSLSGAKVKVVHDKRAARVSREYRIKHKDAIATAISISSLNKKVGNYRLFTTTTDGANPDDGARVLSKIIKIVTLGADKPDRPARSDVIRALFEESLARNNIQKIARDAMRKRLNLIGQWDYIVNSSVSDRDIAGDMKAYLNRIQKWIDAIVPLREEKGHARSGTCWGELVEGAKELKTHLCSMPKGLGAWLRMFGESKGVASLHSLLQVFLDIASADNLRREELDALSAVAAVIAWMSRDEQGTKLLEHDADELEPTLRLLTAQLSGGVRKRSVVADDAKSSESAQSSASKTTQKLVSALVVKLARARILLDHSPVCAEETGALAPSASSEPPKPPLIVAMGGHF